MMKSTSKAVLDSGECADVLRALGDKTRLRVLESLLTHEQCVTDLVLELRKTQPHISHHLRILRHAGIIEGIREGQRICYRVNPQFQRALTSPKAQALDFGCCQLAFPEALLQNRLSRP
ncbi:MAG: winged helix-turn-helix transcriptional regulator [Nitrospira sp.]|nr:winged helix-turn-helix transcriptional regulator [Nitrospira sp.]